MVNRIWYYHFGRGLVDTPSDFGYNGGRPSHPELLDYLASRFMEGGWKIKEIHRLIVNSAAYRQASQVRNDAAPRPSTPTINCFGAPIAGGWKARPSETPRWRSAGALNRQVGGPSLSRHEG